VKDGIESKYDEAMGAYLVSFPEHVSYEALSKWSIEFQEMLVSRGHQKPEALLLDSNKHDFESIECLKFLREILTQLASMKNGICKIAFVQPANYRKSEVVDFNEAYFSSSEEAKSWLMS
jgi:hypothetical protein